MPSPARQEQWTGESIPTIRFTSTDCSRDTGHIFHAIMFRNALTGHDIANFATGRQSSTAHSLKNRALADSMYCIMAVLLVWAKADELEAVKTRQPLAKVLMPLCLSRADPHSSDSSSFKEPYPMAP